jgi:thiosulfate/3-mercaptopyruvate sulfurtransferase
MPNVTASIASPLIQATELKAHGAGSGLLLLDCSFDLTSPDLGERQFREAHIPGAQHLHLETVLSGAKHDAEGRFRGRHPLPARDAFAASMGRLGLVPETDVVAYDRQGAMFAARAWWLLLWLGHARVQVLDGGWAAWQAAGGASQTGDAAPTTAATAYPDREPRVATIGAAELLSHLGRRPVIDARAGERFRGEVEPLDAQAGHIPGARNHCFKDNLQPDGRFLPPLALRDKLAPLLGPQPERSLHQCGSGVTACHNLLAMVAAGWPAGVLYPGSWSEWSADPDRPVARG